MPECITSRENGKIKYASRLAVSAAQRRADGAFLAEGYKLCRDLAAACAPQMAFYTEAARQKHPDLAALACPQYLIPPHVAEKLSDTASGQGVFAVLKMPSPPADVLRPGGRYLALERVQDPGNVGALLRSAAAFGYTAAILSPGCADPFAPKTLRAGMGAAGHLPILQTGDLPATLADLAAKGITCLAAALYHSRPLSALPGPWPGGVCLLIGSEGQGLSDAAIAACHASVRIPIHPAVESLNAGVAGGVLLWHFRGEYEIGAPEGSGGTTQPGEPQNPGEMTRPGEPQEPAVPAAPAALSEVPADD